MCEGTSEPDTRARLWSTRQRLFVRYVGASPKWMIQRYRLQEAAERLAREGAGALSRLACELGYADHTHFMRDFRGIFGRHTHGVRQTGGRGTTAGGLARERALGSRRRATNSGRPPDHVRFSPCGEIKIVTACFVASKKAPPLRATSRLLVDL